MMTDYRAVAMAWVAEPDHRPMVEAAARHLHANESLHLHDNVESKEPCSYCWLRAAKAVQAIERAGQHIVPKLTDEQQIRTAIESVIEDDHEDDSVLAAMIADRVVSPLVAEAKRWHDTYHQHAGAVDEFFGELLELLPGAEDEGMDAYDQIPRGIKRLRSEHAAALDHVRRLCTQRDTVARAVRSPNLTDEQKFAEIREAFAIVDGQRESGEEPEHAGSVWTCPTCLDTTCGDCLEGRCHGSGPCGCDRHEASVQARQLHEADADEAGEGR